MKPYFKKPYNLDAFSVFAHYKSFSNEVMDTVQF